jgi:predicted outer membrane repeat protein
VRQKEREMAKRQRRRRQERRQEHARRQGWTTHQSLITGAGLVAGAVLGAAQPALADEFTVNAGGDAGDGVCQDVSTGDCTLRDAVYSANSDSNYSEINFASNVTGTITLDGDPLPVVYGTYVYGPGPKKLTISGDQNSGIFNAYMAFAGDPLYIGGLKLTEGSQIFGAAVYDENARLSVNNSVLTGNDAFAGGAIYEAGGYDAGYYTDVTFSTLSENSGNYGGAMFAHYYFGVIGSSTFQGNQSKYGGALYAPYTLPNFSGGIFDSTISENSASELGGGVDVFAPRTLNTIISGNEGTDPDVSSAYFYPYNSLIRDPGATTINGDYNIIGADPQLSALADNGGDTPTMKPAAGSPVIDSGYSFSYVDQRILQRPVDNPLVANTNNGNAADMGSVELSLGEGPQPPVTPQQPVRPKKCKKKHKKKHRSAQSAKKKKCKRKKKHKKHSAKAAADRAVSGWRAEMRSADSSRAWGDRAWKIGR